MAVIIDGKRYEGNNLSIVNGVMLIDGKPANPEDEGNTVNIVLEGVTEVYSDQSVTVKGAVSGNVNAGHNVNASNVYGSVMAGSNVNCREVGGNVNAEGNVNCRDIKGNVATNGGRVNASKIFNT